MPAEQEMQSAYMKALITEVSEKSSEYNSYTVVSIFIGGGTPSVVDCIWIEQIMETIYNKFNLAENVEVTIEVNPGTADFEKLKKFYNAGINRISIGLQSTSDTQLKRIGRIHTYDEFEKVYQWAREAGFNNINVDIMSALPGQTIEDYTNTLVKVLGISPPPEHISAYSLIVEEGTPFGRQASDGTLELPDEDSERKMYELTKKLLEQEGYRRYEISNYSLEGYECHHNCGYWSRTDYVGFGIGAASLIHNTRFCNIEDIRDYIKNPLQAQGTKQVLTQEEQIEEFMFLGLRLTQGICRINFFNTFGISIESLYGDIIKKNIQDGLLVENEDKIALTDKGFDVCNYVMAQFLLS